MYEGLAIATAQFEDPTPFPNTVSGFLGGFLGERSPMRTKKHKKRVAVKKSKQFLNKLGKIPMKLLEHQPLVC